jgi:hypothetical protein
MRNKLFMASYFTAVIMVIFNSGLAILVFLPVTWVLWEMLFAKEEEIEWIIGKGRP